MKSASREIYGYDNGTYHNHEEYTLWKAPCQGALPYLSDFRNQSGVDAIDEALVACLQNLSINDYSG